MKFWKEILSNLDKQIELEKQIIEELQNIRKEIEDELAIN